VYPDAGVAAMLSHQWQDRAFNIASLNDRRPVDSDDELVVIACVDPPGAEDCIRVVRQIREQDEQAGVLDRPIVLFNQRMSSGDVGLGLNARRIRNEFLKNFAVTYSLRPIGDIGTVFRRYPGQWKVGRVGRSRPHGAMMCICFFALGPFFSSSFPVVGPGVCGRREHARALQIDQRVAISAAR
ncbi:hypothetical protein Vafri_5306, partial [Volvox africanus]